MAKAIYSELRGVGELVASAILDWPVWAHRKVESLHLMEGERARRRVSVDCSPQAIPWPENMSYKRGPRRRARQILVPLTFMEKGVMRDLDVTNDLGEPLPILGRRENALLAAAAMFALVKAELPAEPSSTLWSDLLSIATETRQGAESKAALLLKRLELSETVRAVVLDFSQNFLMFAVVPKEFAGTRRIIKYGYHWEQGRPEGIRNRLRTGLAGLGFCSTEIAVEVGGIENVESYHLEIPAPEGLVVAELALPDSVSPSQSGPSVIGHAQGNFSAAGVASHSAKAYLRLASRGLLTTVTLYSLLGTALLAALLSFPEAVEEATKDADAAGALLALAPALLFGLAARSSENAVVSRILIPLRVVSVLLSATFVILAGLLIVAPAEMILAYLRYTTLGVAGCAVLLASGWLTTQVASRPRKRS